jgi:large subunit ribosomal protein L27e
MLSANTKERAQRLNACPICRYTLDVDLKGSVTAETFKEPAQRKSAKKQIKAAFQDRYKTGKNKWFFEALRF